MSHCVAFFARANAARPGIWSTCAVNPCSARRILVLRLVTGAAPAFFPEYPKISRSQKGMMRWFWAVVRWCVPSDNFLVITPLMGKLLDAESAEGMNMRTYEVDSWPARSGGSCWLRRRSDEFVDI